MLFTLVADMLTVRFWGIESFGYIFEAVLLIPASDNPTSVHDVPFKRACQSPGVIRVAH